MLTSLLLAACFVSPALAAGEVIEDFETGVEAWSPTMQYGDVSRCRAEAGEGAGGTAGLCVDFDMRSADTNHIAYLREVSLDLSFARGLSFKVRGEGDSVSLFLFVYDSKGRFCNYGPHGTNGDFRSEYADWYPLDLSFDEDRSVQAGDADLTDIRKVGWMLWHMGPAKGKVWFDDLAATDAEGSLDVRPAAISPNGDGLHDTAEVMVRAPRGATLTVDVASPGGKVVATLLREAVVEHGRTKLSWDGTAGAERAPDGRYTVRARLGGEGEATFEAPLSVDTRYSWPPVRYEFEPCFPVGVWFEGAPALSKTPSGVKGARAYYDQCFADMAAHGFNAAAVPNCPENLWEPLLQSADEHGIKIALEVLPLVALVSRKDVPSESEVYDAVRRVHRKIGKHDSLWRYQIRDEPPRAMVDNWLLVRRILAAVDPKRPAFSCFCHPDSLALVTDRAELTEAVVDIYPHGVSTPPQTLGAFLTTLGTFKASIKDNEWWAVLQAFGVPSASSWRYPTAEELNAVTYLSLAAGAKGVFYFIYQYMPDYLWGMVATDGTPQPIYAPASQLAGEMQKLAPLLLTLEGSGEAVAVEGDARVGSFLGPEGQPVLIVASTRPDAAVTAKVSAEGAWEDALTGERLTADGAALAVPLGPGRGRVLLRVP